jgi:hypothetical protein
MSHYKKQKMYISPEEIAIKRYDTPENLEKLDAYVEKFSDAIESNMDSPNVSVSTKVLRSMLNKKVAELKSIYNKDRKTADSIIDDIVNYSMRLKVPSRSLGRLIDNAINGAEK